MKTPLAMKVMVRTWALSMPRRTVKILKSAAPRTACAVLVKIKAEERDPWHAGRQRDGDVSREDGKDAPWPEPPRHQHEGGQQDGVGRPEDGMRRIRKAQLEAELRTEIVGGGGRDQSRYGGSRALRHLPDRRFSRRRGLFRLSSMQAKSVHRRSKPRLVGANPVRMRVYGEEDPKSIGPWAG